MKVPREDDVILVDQEGRDLLTRGGRVRTMGKTQAHRLGRRHRAVSVFVFNSKAQLLLQKRARGKYHSGGLWTNTCCTHPRPGETPAKTARRRLREEMGLRCSLREVLQFTYRGRVGKGLIEDEYDHVFTGVCDQDPRPDAAEVEAWRWVEVAGLGRNLRQNPKRYTCWLRRCFRDVMEATGLARAQRRA